MNDMGVGVEEVVAIDGGNSPEYLMLWFALDAIGAVTSFVNWNLTGDGLVHCAKVRAVASRQTEQWLTRFSFVERSTSSPTSMLSTMLNRAARISRTWASKSSTTTPPSSLP
jgi:acyl-CoA synthetase (AMP-forming)/AMP-acid ligase II